MKHTSRRIVSFLLALSMAASLFAWGNRANSSYEASPLSLGLASSAGSSAVTEPEGENALEAYARQQSYLYGKDYTGSVLFDRETESMLYDASAVPVQSVGYAIQDYDGDGQPELLVVGLNEDYTFRLELYEYEGGQVKLADTLDLHSEKAGLPNVIASSESNYAAVADVYSYEADGLQIGIEISQIASLFADGVQIEFLSVSYEEGVLALNAHAVAAGSDGIYNSVYMDQLAELGIYPPWEALFAQQTYVREYVQDYQEIARVSTTYTVDTDAANAWLERRAEPLQCSRIHFDDAEQLAANTAAVQAASHTAPEHSALLQKYISALNRFVYDEVWPDGKPVTYDPAFNDMSKNQYAIFDVDQDGRPELLIRFSETFTAAMCEAVLEYDQAVGSFRWELRESPGCIYYSNGIVKGLAAHNHTSSEFWPFSLYGYNSNTDSYDLKGSVYARDKDYAPEEFPEKTDLDGNGRVYYLDGDTPVDDKDYEDWLRSVAGDAKEVEIPWKGMLDKAGFDVILESAEPANTTF